MRGKSSKLGLFKENREIDGEELFSNPIIGYDKSFWNYCTDTNKMSVSSLKRSNKRHLVSMKCERGHEFKLSPYRFFYEHKRCPHCMSVTEVGAINIDSTIEAFWNDSRYNLADISEHSNEQYFFLCPFCKRKFIDSMMNMVNKSPKCMYCMDGQKIGLEVSPEEGDLFLFRVRAKRQKKRI